MHIEREQGYTVNTLLDCWCMAYLVAKVKKGRVIAVPGGRGSSRDGPYLVAGDHPMQG